MPDNVTIFEGQAVEVQRRSTATLPPGIDLIRPSKAYELHQRPASTFLPLVHTEEVTHAVANVTAGHIRAHCLTICRESMRIAEISTAGQTA